MTTKLYKWQEECIKRWMANNGRGIVQAVTGSGKTLLALTAMEHMDRKINGKLHVKIVVPTSTLMRQWKQALLKHLSAAHSDSPAAEPSNSASHNDSLSAGSNNSASCSGSPSTEPDNSILHDADKVRSMIGLRGGGAKSSPEHKYMIYVINSARYELARQILTELKNGEYVLLIADECHHYESGQNRLIFEFLPYIKEYEDHFFSLGLSATLPTGQALRYLTSVLGRKIYHYGIKEALAGDTICPYDVYHISLSLHDDERDEYENLTEQMTFLYGKLVKVYPSLNSLTQKERFEALRSLANEKNRKIADMASSYMNLTFMRRKLVCMASSRISCARNLIRCLDPKDKIIIFSERISQADELYRLLQTDYPEKTGRYHSQMGNQANRNALELFRTGNIRILIACKAIDEGLDVPDASVGIILSGTSTQKQRIQRLGRIIRKKNVESKAALYYLHIAETVEDSCYLPDSAEHRLFELTYDDQTQHFYNPGYDDRASALLAEMESNGANPEILTEANRCLCLGRVRSDWTLTPDELDREIQSAKYTSEKNYWVCMKKL